MLKFNEEKQRVGWKCQHACQTVTRGVFRWGCLQKLHWGLASPGEATLLHLLLTKPDNRVCCPIKKQQLCWKRVEFFRSKFYYQKRNISHIKSQSVAASSPNFPRYFPIPFTLKWCFSCQSVLMPGTGATATKVPALCHRRAPQCSPSSGSMWIAGAHRAAVPVG